MPLAKSWPNHRVASSILLRKRLERQMVQSVHKNDLNNRGCVERIPWSEDDDCSPRTRGRSTSWFIQCSHQLLSYRILMADQHEKRMQTRAFINPARAPGTFKMWSTYSIAERSNASWKASVAALSKVTSSAYSKERTPLEDFNRRRSLDQTTLHRTCSVTVKKNLLETTGQSCLTPQKTITKSLESKS